MSSQNIIALSIFRMGNESLEILLAGSHGNYHLPSGRLNVDAGAGAIETSSLSILADATKMPMADIIGHSCHFQQVETTMRSDVPGTLLSQYCLLPAGLARLVHSAHHDTYKWFKINHLPEKIDNRKVVLNAIATVLRFVRDEQSMFKLLDTVFTMAEVKRVYEALGGKQKTVPNFQKDIKERYSLINVGKSDRIKKGRKELIYSLAPETTGH